MKHNNISTPVLREVCTRYIQIDYVDENYKIIYSLPVMPVEIVGNENKTIEIKYNSHMVDETRYEFLKSILKTNSGDYNEAFSEAGKTKSVVLTKYEHPLIRVLFIHKQKEIMDNSDKEVYKRYLQIDYVDENYNIIESEPELTFNIVGNEIEMLEIKYRPYMVDQTKYEFEKSLIRTNSGDLNEAYLEKGKSKIILISGSSHAITRVLFVHKMK